MGGILELAVRYRDEGADELVFYDITASPEGRSVDRTWISRVAAELDIPFCVAGGIRSAQAAEEVLAAGADKISINTPALENPKLIDELARRFGSQCVVASVDARRVEPGPDGKPRWEIFTHGGRRATGIDALDHAARVAGLGAGELLVTSMDGDGTKKGYDLELTRTIADMVSVPVIASGGAGAVGDFAPAVEAGADAVLAASIFHYNEFSIPDTKAYLAARGVPVRL